MAPYGYNLTIVSTDVTVADNKLERQVVLAPHYHYIPQ